MNPRSGNVILGTGNPYNGVVIPGSAHSRVRRSGRVLAATPATANQCDGASCTGLFAPNLPQATSRPPITSSRAWASPTRSIRRPCCARGVGNFATRMGLLDNIFPGGNSPFQPFVTVNNVSVDNPGASLTSGTAAPLTITTLNPNLKPPQAWNWNVTVERQLPAAFAC